MMTCAGPAPTPFLDNPPTDWDPSTEGTHLQKDAASVLMKILYGARLVRYDLLWTVNSLAREVTKWTRGCDRKHYKVVCYLNATNDLSLENFAGDAPAMPLLEGPRGTQLGLPPKSGLEPRAFLPLALSESLPELRLRPL